MKSIGKLSIVLGIICIVSFAISIALGPVLLFNGFETQSVNQFENMSSTGISNLNIDLLDTEVIMHPIKGNEFEFKLTGSYAKNYYNNTINFTLEKHGDSLKATIDYPKKLVVINRHLELDVGVPESYYGDVYVKTASGDIYVKGLDIKDFEADSSSGNIKSENMKIQNCRLESVSGNVKTFNLSSENFEIKTTSGKIDLEKSGKINNVKSSSGNIRIYNYDYEGDSYIETISGNVYLNFERGYSAKVIFKSVSGNFDNLYGDVSEGKNVINVKTTSGNLDLS